MKSQNRVSQLTLELYRRGLATYKERKQVEKALKTDGKVQSRYKAIQDSDREIQQILSQELRRLNIQETPPAPALRKKNVVAGFILAAAILLCVLVPAFLYLKSHSRNKENAIAEETIQETETQEETAITENMSVEDTPSPEQPVRRERGGSNTQAAIAESPHSESGKTEIAALPTPDAGVRMRGEGQAKDQSGSAAVPEQESNLNIPPGITFIFENMFANRNLTFAVIPSRITSIGKNAFAGNPLVSVTVGANVDVHDEAFPGNFAKAYNSYGKAAGTYIRSDSNSEDWERK